MLTDLDATNKQSNFEREDAVYVAVMNSKCRPLPKILLTQGLRGYD